MIRENIKIILVFGMAMTGAAFLIGGIAGFAIEGTFYRSAEKAEGELIEMVPDEEGTPLYPRFSFVDHTGERQTVTSKTGQHPFPFEVSDHIPVLYDPADPANAKIDTFGQVWFFSTAIPLISGIMFLFCGAGYWLLKRFGQKGMADRDRTGPRGPAPPHHHSYGSVSGGSADSRQASPKE